MNAQRRGKCLRAPPLRPRPHAALFAYAYCDRPDSFFYADHSFLSRALLFFRPLSLSFSFISWRVPVRAHRPTSFRSRGECHRSTNGALITRGMCIRSHSGMRVSSGDVNANRVIQNDSIAQNTVGKIRRLPVEERVSASQLVSTECPIWLARKVKADTSRRFLGQFVIHRDPSSFEFEISRAIYSVLQIFYKHVVTIAYYALNQNYINVIFTLLIK